ncbi:magnesium transporter CorA family protein [Candidatus Woesearchaeota archaeon]|nr:magnesium transporter CorA family protein [Candidatus Woesearchaeota archaeon]
MIEYYKKTSKDEILLKIEKFSKDCWIKSIDPNEDELKLLSKKFSLDKELLKDGLDIYETPRIVEEDSNFYFFFRVPLNGNSKEESTSSFLFIISKNCVITLSKFDLEIFHKISRFKSFYTDKKTRILLLFLSIISKSFWESSRDILKSVRKNKINISQFENKDLFKLVIQEDVLNDYLYSFSPLIDMYTHMLKIKSIEFKEEEKEDIEDLIVDLNQTFNTCRTALKNMSTMRDYYSATLTNNLNKIINLLTIFTIVLTVPTVISSMYGMNIKLPFQNNPYLFFFLLLLIMVIWLLIILFFRKKKVI